MQKYQLYVAGDIDEALDYLAQLENIKILAGGTDILVDLHKGEKRLGKIDYLLDITRINSLKYIRETGKYLELGSLVTHAMLMEDRKIVKRFPFLAEAARTIGSTQIRNRATVGGNINNASPAADLLPVLIALKAVVILKSKDGERIIELEKFLTGPFKTDLRPGELMTGIKIPLLSDQYYGNFQKIGRRKILSIARVNLALVAVVKRGKFEDIRIVPGAVTPSPCSFKRLESKIRGKKILDINPEEMGKNAAREMVSITGQRWSTPYKKPALGSLVKRALKCVIEEAGRDEQADSKPDSQ